MKELLIMIGEWAASNWQGISLAAVMTTVGGVLSYYVVRHFLPKLQNKLLGYVVKIVSKMFGMDVEGVDEMVKKLPIVDKMNEWQASLQSQNELKLIELKNKIVSPKLSEAERVTYQGMFDKIMNDLGDKVSYATLKVINEIDQKAKETIEKI